MGRKKFILQINVHMSPDAKYNIVVRMGYKPDGEVLLPVDKEKFCLEEGIYNIIFEADGFCSQEHLILIDSNVQRHEYIVDIEPVRIRNNLAEFKGSMFYLPEAFEKAVYDDEIEEQVSKYEFVTPAFEEEKGELCFTSSEESREYINHICQDSNKIKLFNVENINIALASKNSGDLPGDIFKAIEKLRQNEKLTVFYQAQVHGTEPASGEGALAFITEAAMGKLDKLLEVMDIWVIPCCNPIGTDRFERECNGININRDALALECSETQTIHSLFLKLLPEVVIDAHTFTRANGIKSPYLDRAVLDVRLSPAQSENINKNINRLSAELAEKTIWVLKKQSIRVGYYGDSTDPSASRIFYGLFNTCSFLLESEGTRSGKMHFRRNVWCQLTAVKCLLAKASENAEYIKKTVLDSRRTLAHTNNPDEADVYVLKHGKSNELFFKTKQPAFDLNGNIVDEKNIIFFPKRKIVLKQTEKPYAYIIPKDAVSAEYMVKMLAKNGINVCDLSEQVTLPVEQYYSCGEDILTYEETYETFDNGAYMVLTGQIASNIICALFEPESDDAARQHGSFVQRGILEPDSKNRFNLYRMMKSDIEMR